MLFTIWQAVYTPVLTQVFKLKLPLLPTSPCPQSYHGFMYMCSLGLSLQKDRSYPREVSISQGNSATSTYKLYLEINNHLLTCYSPRVINQNPGGVCNSVCGLQQWLANYYTRDKSGPLPAFIHLGPK